jgi:hypothetical protein
MTDHDGFLLAVTAIRSTYMFHSYSRIVRLPLYLQSGERRRKVQRRVLPVNGLRTFVQLRHMLAGGAG